MEEGERVGKERGKAAGGGDPRGWGGSRPRSAALGHLHRAAGPSGGPEATFPSAFRAPAPQEGLSGCVWIVHL